MAVCRGHDELGAFFRKHSIPGTGVTFFEFVQSDACARGQSFAGPPRQAGARRKLTKERSSKSMKAARN